MRREAGSLSPGDGTAPDSVSYDRITTPPRSSAIRHEPSAPPTPPTPSRGSAAPLARSARSSWRAADPHSSTSSRQSGSALARQSDRRASSPLTAESGSDAGAAEGTAGETAAGLDVGAAATLVVPGPASASRAPSAPTLESVTPTTIASPSASAPRSIRLRPILRRRAETREGMLSRRAWSAARAGSMLSTIPSGRTVSPSAGASSRHVHSGARAGSATDPVAGGSAALRDGFA